MQRSFEYITEFKLKVGISILSGNSKITDL